MDELFSILTQEELYENNDQSNYINEKSDETKLKEVDLNLFGTDNETCKPTSLSNSYAESKSCESFFPMGDDSSDEEILSNPTSSKYNEYGREVKSILNTQKKNSCHQPLISSKNISTASWKKSPHVGSNISKPSESIKDVQSKIPIKNKEENVDILSGIAIKNPVVSSVEMKERMLGRRLIQMSCISMNIKGGDIEGDWVTVGVIVKKCDQKKSSKGSMYSIWNLSDLKDCNKTISLFLFGKTHDQHWKTSVGSVVGLLNPTIMPQKDSYKGNDLSISVDNPQKLLYMGQSRDFGVCKGRRKDGATCTMFVNRSHCEYCQYHVCKEYYKTASKRMELQAAYSSAEPKGLKQRLLEKQGIFYGGQYFSPSRAAEKPTKSKKTLNQTGLISSVSQQLQKKANTMAADARKEAASKLDGNMDQKSDEQSELEKHSKGISSGSRNLFLHLNKETKPSQGKEVKHCQVRSISAKELLTLHATEMSRNTQNRKLELNKSVMDVMPILGKGSAPGHSITLGTLSSSLDKAKLRAIRKVQLKGPIQKKEPNFSTAKRHSLEFQHRIKKRLADELEESKNGPIKRLKQDLLSTEEFQKLLNKKSNHDYLVQEHEIEQENNYFGIMEKREQLETKMGSIMEIPCKVVSCKNCHYTALAALESCRQESHNLVVSKAVKRFFKCQVCKRHTISFSKLPTKPCSGCGERDYMRVPMFQERKGPKLDSEKLLIRGNEINSLNSTSYTKDININL